eukprot:3997595-Pleurochrysis_carterae.AAC.1
MQAVIGCMKEVTVAKGSTIIKQGDGGDDFYVVEKARRRVPALSPARLHILRQFNRFQRLCTLFCACFLARARARTHARWHARTRWRLDLEADYNADACAHALLSTLETQRTAHSTLAKAEPQEHAPRRIYTHRSFSRENMSGCQREAEAVFPCPPSIPLSLAYSSARLLHTHLSHIVRGRLFTSASPLPPISFSSSFLSRL